MVRFTPIEPVIKKDCIQKGVGGSGEAKQKFLLLGVRKRLKPA